MHINVHTEFPLVYQIKIKMTNELSVGKGDSETNTSILFYIFSVVLIISPKNICYLFY